MTDLALAQPISVTEGEVNRLRGLTILRFAHAYEAGGGVELHLRDLNHGLSLRNTLNTILVHLTKAKEPTPKRTEFIGESKLVKVALQTTGNADPVTLSEEHGRSSRLREWVVSLLDLMLFSSAANRLFARIFLRGRRVPARPNDASNVGPTVEGLIQRYRVDLIVLHTNGSADASAVLAAARRADVPVAAIHHFSNHRLGDVSVRQQMAEVDLVAGASTVDLPRYLRRRFSNLSDAVDLNFFRVENALPVPLHLSAPILFAPGRMMRDKGQMDALQVATALHRRGVRNTLVFAGRVDDPAFERDLRKVALAAGISDHVHFVGELTLSQYRDWFGAVDVMLMPTRHHEGMPRTLIDSQAMRVPPIVYNIGGTPEGVRHGQTGFLVRLGDLEAMTEHAATLLKDEALRQNMAAAGRAFVESQFSMDAFLTRHEHFYLDALSSHRRR